MMKRSIQIREARVHNLQAVDVDIPKNAFVVVTGVSGSGKSSLAFDTLYAEGRRRYVESLSSYARQFLGKMEKPDVKEIIGITPAIAIEQKVVSRNSRSTVGTTTEIFDYLKILFARIGKTISPISGKEVTRDTVTDVVNLIFEAPAGSKFALYAPIVVPEDRPWQKHLELLQSHGFNRVKWDGQITTIEEAITNQNYAKEAFLLIDRISNSDNEENRSRIADSVETAFHEGHGVCNLEQVVSDGDNRWLRFSNLFEADGIQFEPPHPSFFSFNSPIGACKACGGFGTIVGINPHLVVPNPELSVFEKAIVCWRGEKMKEYLEPLLAHAHEWDFPIHRPYQDLNEEQVQLLWEGKDDFWGLNRFFAFIEEQSYKIQYRVMHSRYKGKTVCPECQGSRIRKDALYVQVGGKNIQELLSLQIGDLRTFFDGLQLGEMQTEIAARLLQEIQSRLKYLTEVGLHYLTLNRKSNTLSGGESQRIHLSTSLGSSLVGSTYILDEPSIGLHPRDTQQLIEVILALRDLGNTVVVVEHDEEVMRAADYIIDLGPEAGALGGHVVFAGEHAKLSEAQNSLTADYLTGRKEIITPENRRTSSRSIQVQGAAENNLQNITVDFPLNQFVAVTGVSGSGKSTLVRSILYPALCSSLETYTGKPGKYEQLNGNMSDLSAVEMVDQNPIGKSSRSNPVTYLKAYDEIRALMSSLPLAKSQGFSSGAFSFNVAGGRCDMCEGEGSVKIEMQFMADIEILCEECSGHRFKPEILEVAFEGKNISDLLHLTIDEAIAFFESHAAENTYCKKIAKKLAPLQLVGLGYVQMGQSSNTLSGGEAQRVKLASFLSRGSQAKNTLFIFDEPTTGLHAHDVQKLITSLNALVDKGNTVIIIEHNMDVIKTADWIIELGPEGGKAGGQLVFAGTPETMIEEAQTHTAEYLRKAMEIQKEKS